MPVFLSLIGKLAHSSGKGGQFLAEDSVADTPAIYFE